MKELEQPLTEPASGASELTRAKQLDRLKHLFRHLGDNPSDQFLFDVVRRYRQGDKP